MWQVEVERVVAVNLASAGVLVLDEALQFGVDCLPDFLLVDLEGLFCETYKTISKGINRNWPESEHTKINRKNLFTEFS